MIVAIDKVREAIPAYSAALLDDGTIYERLRAVESRIRAITHNNFQIRHKRAEGRAEGGLFVGSCALFGKGQRVQVSKSGANDGLYDIVGFGNGTVTLSRALSDADFVRLTVVEYPPDVLEGMLSLLSWEEDYRGHQGVSEERLSRHSVSYEAPSAGGYPSSMTAFLAPYMKARF